MKKLPALGLSALLALACPAWAAPFEDRSVNELPVMKGPADLPEVPIKRKKNTICTVVHVHSESGQVNPGFFVRITATALPGKPGVPAELSYDKFLGPLTMKSLGAVIKVASALHKGWPRGENLQISFSNRPSPAELTAASLADALLIDSLLRDYDLEQNLGVIGNLQEDGTIEKVESIPERLAGAARARAARVIVPEKNSRQVGDFLLSQGIPSFIGTQIFTAKNFNEAGILSTTQLDDQTKEAITLFGSVQRTLAGAGGAAIPLLRGEALQGTLQKVLTLAPNHLSAKILLDWGTGQKTQISFDGSTDTIDRYAPDLIRALRAKPEEALKAPKANVAANIAALKYVKDRLDPQARGYAEALLKFGDIWQRSAGTSSVPPKRLTGAAQQAFDAARQAGNDEWTKMVQARVNGPTGAQ